MYKPSVTCTIICDKHQVKTDGTAGLYIRLTIARKSRLIALNKYINPDCFDFDKKRINIDLQLHEYQDKKRKGKAEIRIHFYLSLFVYQRIETVNQICLNYPQFARGYLLMRTASFLIRVVK